MEARSKKATNKLDRLTPRETEVLTEIAEGKSNAAVASTLVLSERAVEKHINSIYTKLDLSPNGNPTAGSRPCSPTWPSGAPHDPGSGAPITPPTPEAVRVLVVDDQQIYRDVAQFVIEMSDGFELAGTAETAEEGIGLTDELRPDLVLMDINLPGINGLEATRRIVASHPDTGVIVFSTHSATDYASRANAAGAIGFIAKAELDPDVLSRVWHASRQ